jgi:uncharacterized protein YoxC
MKDWIEVALAIALVAFMIYLLRMHRKYTKGLTRVK